MKSYFIAKAVFCIVAFCCLLSCKTIAPNEPKYQTEPLPPITPSVSYISAPISVELKTYLQEAEKSIPKTMSGGEDYCSGVSYNYDFEREPIKFKGSGKYINYGLNGKYGISMNYCPECTYLFSDDGMCIIPRVYLSCGVDEPMRRMSVAFQTGIEITNDYKFKSNTELTKFDLVDACEVSIFNFDVTSQLRKQLTIVLENLESEIDDQIAAINIKPELEKLWKNLNDPINIQDYGLLYIHPKNISLNSLQFKETAALLDIIVTLQPTFSTEKEVNKISKLPNLTKITPQDGFNIDLDIHAGYDSLSKIINKNLQGDTLYIKKNQVILDSISVSGTINQELALKLNFSGKRKGTLYLKGNPVFDHETKIVSFPNLDFELETKNTLLRTAKWLLNEKITKLIREQATFDITDYLTQAQTLIQKEMNKEISDGIYLAGNIHKLDLVSLFLNEKNIVLRVNAKGKVTVNLK
jgi:hypothetical protein